MMAPMMLLLLCIIGLLLLDASASSTFRNNNKRGNAVHHRREHQFDLSSSSLSNGPINNGHYDVDYHHDESIHRQQQQHVAPPESSSSTMNDAKKSSSWLSLLDKPSPTMGRLIVVLAAALCGTNFSMVKLVDQAVPTALSAAMRFTVAALCVSAFVLKGERRHAASLAMQQKRRVATWRGAEVGLWYFGGYLTQALALRSVNAGYNAFVGTLAVVIVPVLEILVQRSKALDFATVGSVSLALLGAAFLQLGPTLFGDAASRLAAAENSVPLGGNLLCYAQALFFGIGYWRLGNASSKLQHQDGRITLGISAAIAAGSIGYSLLPISGIGNVSWKACLSWFTNPFIVGSLLWTGLVSTTLAWYLETVALKSISASELTILMTTVSLWAAFFAYLTMGEVLSPMAWVGGFMILSGCIVNAIGSKGEDVDKDDTTTSAYDVMMQIVPQQETAAAETTAMPLHLHVHKPRGKHTRGGATNE